MPEILYDPLFYAVSIPAVMLVGFSKGGFGGAMALVGLPLMALVMPPVQAAAIMLPILIVMDVVSLWTWRGTYDRKTLKLMLPGAMVGIAIGWATAALVTAGAVRLIVGVVALLFFLRWLAQILRRSDGEARNQNALRASFWSIISGFTSFVAHAGGPPYQVYALQLRHVPAVYTGTSVIFFSIVNAVKVIPYFALGQFDTTNLAASAVLMPIAPIATLTGAWLVRRMRPDIFYGFMYSMMAIVAAKLIYDGLADILG
ncbi:MAG: sulfite exporter TauE/SafE family protein [Rhizobiaceae bacterium]|nr:sulfite exporter TauE/SafE family protein [Rhizobiaceae bacterium]